VAVAQHLTMALPTTSTRRLLVVMNASGPGGGGGRWPLVAIYEDGLVIYRRDPMRRGRYVSELAGVITPELAQTVAASIARQIATTEVRPAISVTELPTTQILARVGDEWTANEFYGLSSPFDDHAGSDEFGSRFWDAARTLASAVPADAQPWQPDILAVTLSRFDDAKVVQPWPATVPPPPAVASRDDCKPPIQCGFQAGGRTLASYEYVVGGGCLATIRSFLARTPGETPIRVSGHDWRMSVRGVLPDQDVIYRVEAAMDEARWPGSGILYARLADLAVARLAEPKAACVSPAPMER
jgi:hypothetical protein